MNAEEESEDHHAEPLDTLLVGVDGVDEVNEAVRRISVQLDEYRQDGHESIRVVLAEGSA